MGLFEAVFGRRKTAIAKGNADTNFETFTAYSPRFTNWGGQIYESELVRAAVDAYARHISKLSMTMIGSAHRDLYTKIKSAPNPWQTWSAFLERCSNIYQVQNNLFIVPILEGDFRKTVGFYPVVPSECEIVDRAGKPYLKFNFWCGKTSALPLEKVAIVTKHQLKDDFFGEKNSALNGTMELINMVNQGIMEGVKNSASFRFMAQLTTHTFDEDIVKERKRFDKLNFQDGGGGGLLLFNATMKDVKQLTQQQYSVDPAQMKLIGENVQNYFGVSEKILKNSALGDEMDAFFNGAIEPFAIKLSEALTRIVYTQEERNIGNQIIFTANRLQYMSVTAKVTMAKELGDRGALMIDEIRELFNYAPLPDGAGQHAPIRGEYYMVDEGKNDDSSQDNEGGSEDGTDAAGQQSSDGSESGT